MAKPTGAGPFGQSGVEPSGSIESGFRREFAGHHPKGSAMRWKRLPKQNYQSGNHYVIRVFAWLPISIDRETRWLEWCDIKANYTHTGWGSDSPWVYLNFVNKEQQ